MMCNGKMKLGVLRVLLPLVGALTAGCSGWTEMWESVPLVQQNRYSLCSAISGAVIDSLTDQPLEGVRVTVLRHNIVRCVDTTDISGLFGCNLIRIVFSSSPVEVSELKAKSPIRRELDLKLVFEKEGYRKRELFLPIEFIYCSPHPQQPTIPEAKMPDVFLLRE